MGLCAGVALDMTNTELVDHPNNEKEPLPPMPRLLITTADHKLQVWDFKSEGGSFVPVVSSIPWHHVDQATEQGPTDCSCREPLVHCSTYRQCTSCCTS